jgi:hypothetical protein
MSVAKRVSEEMGVELGQEVRQSMSRCFFRYLPPMSLSLAPEWDFTLLACSSFALGSVTRGVCDDEDTSLLAWMPAKANGLFSSACWLCTTAAAHEMLALGGVM